MHSLMHGVSIGSSRQGMDSIEIYIKAHTAESASAADPASLPLNQWSDSWRSLFLIHKMSVER